MSDRDRLEQLHGLVARLERMPASEERDAILRKARSRAVDVETGVMPEPAPKPRRKVVVRAPAAVQRPAAPARVVRPPRAAPAPVSLAPLVIARPPQGGALDLLEDGRLLCLDDAPDAPSGDARPWSAGLRG